LLIFRFHKLSIEANAYAHYTSLLCFALALSMKRCDIKALSEAGGFSELRFSMDELKQAFFILVTFTFLTFLKIFSKNFFYYKQELSYRKHIVRQLRAQYVEAPLP